jgi:hypothetical protein
VSSSGEPEITDDRNFTQLNVLLLRSIDFDVTSARRPRLLRTWQLSLPVACNVSVCIYMTPR